jgi:hypothetical protein
MTARADFWARRKAAVQAEEAAVSQAEQAVLDDAHRAEIEARDDAEILAELNLPDPDALKLGDDVTGFMSKAVPDRLRRRALRQLWRLNPVLANIDGLVDYGEDYTDAATVIENMQTAYQVGKGMLAHVEEMARQAEAKEALENAPEEDIAEPEEEPEVTLAAAEPEAPETPDPEPHYIYPDPIEPEYDAPVRRRMRFAFEENAHG